MATRVNIMLDDDSSRVIERLPRRQRRDPGVGWYFQAAGRHSPDGCTARALAHGLDRPDRSMDMGGAGAATAVIVTPDASVLLKWVLPGNDEQDTDAAVAGTLDLGVSALGLRGGQHAGEAVSR